MLQKKEQIEGIQRSIMLDSVCIGNEGEGVAVMEAFESAPDSVAEVDLMRCKIESSDSDQLGLQPAGDANTADACAQFYY